MFYMDYQNCSSPSDVSGIFLQMWKLAFAEYFTCPVSSRTRTEFQSDYVIHHLLEGLQASTATTPCPQSKITKGMSQTGHQ